MDEIKFEWDENKNETNKRKHHISFEEAQTVFSDEEALVIDDPDHSEEEASKNLMKPKVKTMREEYDFSNARKNPYITKKDKKQITINIDLSVINYFKAMSERTDIPYQVLINSYLLDCASNKRELRLNWA